MRKQKQVRKFLTDVIGTINDEKYNEDRYKKLFYLLSTDGTSMISLNNAFSIRNIVTNLHSRNRPLKMVGWMVIRLYLAVIQLVYLVRYLFREHQSFYIAQSGQCYSFKSGYFSN